MTDLTETYIEYIIKYVLSQIRRDSGIRHQAEKYQNLDSLFDHFGRILSGFSLDDNPLSGFKEQVRQYLTSKCPQIDVTDSLVDNAIVTTVMLQFVGANGIAMFHAKSDAVTDRMRGFKKKRAEKQFAFESTTIFSDWDAIVEAMSPFRVDATASSLLSGLVRCEYEWEPLFKAAIAPPDRPAPVPNDHDTGVCAMMQIWDLIFPDAGSQKPRDSAALVDFLRRFLSPSGRQQRGSRKPRAGKTPWKRHIETTHLGQAGRPAFALRLYERLAKASLIVPDLPSPLSRAKNVFAVFKQDCKVSRTPSKPLGNVVDIAIAAPWMLAELVRGGVWLSGREDGMPGFPFASRGEGGSALYTIWTTIVIPTYAILSGSNIEVQEEGDIDGEGSSLE